MTANGQLDINITLRSKRAGRVFDRLWLKHGVKATKKKKKVLGFILAKVKVSQMLQTLT